MNPTRSAKSTVATRRSSGRATRPCPHEGQNRASVGAVVPHAGHCMSARLRFRSRIGAVNPAGRLNGLIPGSVAAALTGPAARSGPGGGGRGRGPAGSPVPVPRPARRRRGRRNVRGARRGRAGCRRGWRGSARAPRGGGGAARGRWRSRRPRRTARTTASSWSWRSERPGRIGATSTPQGMPASFRRATASTRLRGCGVPGSVVRHTSSSSVPMEKLIDTCVRRLASVRTSRSRSTNVPLVRIENGLRAAPRTSTMPRVNRYLPSARWYGSVFVPIAIGSPCQRLGATSTRSRSTAFTFTTITRSNSVDGSRPRYSCVGRAKQYVHAWLQPR